MGSEANCLYRHRRRIMKGFLFEFFSTLILLVVVALFIAYPVISLIVLGILIAAYIIINVIINKKGEIHNQEIPKMKPLR